ncbi:MAG TPA: PilZ domain-containing protein, partial [Sandaracinaceae bacterium]
GMHLVTDARIPYGTKVQLEFFLPALREEARIEATVRWQKDGGMGVQFGSLRAREVWALNQLFKEGGES